MNIGSIFQFAETPAGAINGSNKTFFLQNSPLPAASLRFFKNGVFLSQGNDYTLIGTLVTLLGTAPQVGDVLSVYYRYPSTFFYQGNQFADSEVPNPTDLTYKIFSLINIPLSSSSLELYWNGILMRPGIDYTLANNVITLLTARAVNPLTDTFVSYYQYAGVCAGIPSYAENEIPVGVIDGANKTFTLVHPPNPQISLHLYENGVGLGVTDFAFNIANLNQFILNVAPPAGSILRVFYRYTDTSTPIRSQAFAKLDIIPYIQRNLNDVNNKIWPLSALQQFVNQAEVDISNDLNTTWIRFPLNIQSGIGVYTLPQNIKEITRITYRRYKVELLSQTELSVLSPLYRTQASRPRWASIQYDGYLGLRFFPVPYESLPVLSDQNNIYTDTNISNECVVSAYLYPTECTTFFQLPDYLYRRTIRFFVLWKAFGMEGSGQILDTSQYFKTRYEAQMVKNRMYMSNIHSSKERIMSDIPLSTYGKKPHRPVLPPNFGITVTS